MPALAQTKSGPLTSDLQPDNRNFVPITRQLGELHQSDPNQSTVGPDSLARSLRSLSRLASADLPVYPDLTIVKIGGMEDGLATILPGQFCPGFSLVVS